jgi:2-amino-4-hydroxy-6-hydroxymethyldihydropteridine diphosphokinase
LSVLEQTLSKQAFISLGSNIEPEKYLILAAKCLVELGEVVAYSQVYQNPAVGPNPQDDFLNAAILIETELSAEMIRMYLRQIEAELGRVRTADKYAPRTIDLDLCLLNNQVLKTDHYVIPDPDLLKRAHLAVPIAELAPEFCHPVTGETLRTIADRLQPETKLSLRSDVTQELHQTQFTSQNHEGS